MGYACDNDWPEVKQNLENFSIRNNFQKAFKMKQEFLLCQSEEEENAWIDSKIDEFYKQLFSFPGKQLEIPINYVIKDNNMIVAGIKSCFYLEEVLSIGVLFVDSNYRNKGLGSLLLSKIETDAKAKGAKLAHLYAFDNTKNFYLRHDYNIFGVLENCPKSGHKCYYLKKELIVNLSNKSHIREMNTTDINILSETFCFPWTTKQQTIEKWSRCFKEHEQQKRTVYLLEKNRHVVGYASLLYFSEYAHFRKNDIPEINDVWIHENFRNQGLGKMLIEYLENMAFKKGYKQIGLGVGLYRDYGSAQRLYYKLGYIPDGNGVTYKGIFVVPGQQYPIDDDLIFWLHKKLA